MEKHKDIIIPAAIYLAGFALLLDAITELRFSVLDFKAYQFMFHWLSPQLIFWRYCLSILWRCAYILALAGVCLRKDIFRRWLIVLTWLDVAVLFWKHPYQAIVNADIYMHSHPGYFLQTMHLPLFPQPVYPFIVMVMIQLWVEDLCKAALILTFFSFQDVRRYFK